MRKQSLAVPLTILTAIAAAACNDANQEQGFQHCVDENGVVVDESNCSDAGAARLDSQGNPVPHSGFIWYYGGTRFSPGVRVYGGGYSPRVTTIYSSPGGHFTTGPTVGVGRGGFGGAGIGHAGGGGE